MSAHEKSSGLQFFLSGQLWFAVVVSVKNLRPAIASADPYLICWRTAPSTEWSGQFDFEFAAQGKRGAFELLQRDRGVVVRKEQERKFGHAAGHKSAGGGRENTRQFSASL